MPKFIKGKVLSKLFFDEIVKPILKSDFPYLKYSAGLLGDGSEVIDFDTVRSTDHDWGPRVLLFLSQNDLKKKKQISELLSRKSPSDFKGFSIHFSWATKKNVDIFSIESFFKSYLHFDINKNISVYDWLVFSEHRLLAITKWTVFHDDLWLVKIIEKFSYYPKDVWYYLLASQWVRISQEEHFMWRCGELNDEIGSKIIATRLVKDIMKICFLMEKQYTPYIKWFWTAFKDLKSWKKLQPILHEVLKQNDWKLREKHLTKAYQHLAKIHNSLKITKTLTTKVNFFHGRPFLVINGWLFASEIKKHIKNPEITSITADIGSINQFSDSTDILVANTQKFKVVYK